jgi:hypothetical protein
MKLQIFAIKDTKVNAFMQPFFMRTEAEAIRAFATSTNDPSTNFNKHPEDYHLFQLGEYDEETGKLESKEPTQKAHALALLNPEEVIDKDTMRRLAKLEQIVRDYEAKPVDFNTATVEPTKKAKTKRSRK